MRVLLAVVGAVALLVSAAGCTSSPPSGDQVIRVVYPEQSPSSARTEIARGVAAAVEAAHPGTTVELTPINATDDDYHVKVALMQRAPSTAPDVVMLDSFQVHSQVAAGFLAPLDPALVSWPDWTTQFPPTARELARGADGATYGIPVSGGFIGLWYDREIFDRAGLPTEWTPLTWDEVVAAAEAVHAVDPAVVPFAAQMTKAGGEGTSMQTVEVLLQGTPGGLDATLYDPQNEAWVTGSSGFIDALQFLDRLRLDDLGPSVTQLQNPNLGRLMGPWFREGRIAMALTGNWLSAPWQEGGSAEWSDWPERVGWTAMPTIDGAAPGRASMTGGWVWSLGSGAAGSEAAFDVLTSLTDRDNSLAFALATGDMPVRDDVADAPQLQRNPSLPFFHELLDVAGIRPGLEEYPRVSVAIQRAAEAVATGAMTPHEAAARYDAEVLRLTGGAG